jgi:hypothetical protein
MDDWTQAKEKMSKTIELMQGCKPDGSVKKKYEEKLARR